MPHGVRYRVRVLLTVLGLPTLHCAGCGEPSPRYPCPDRQDVYCNHCSRGRHDSTASTEQAAGRISLAAD